MTTEQRSGQHPVTYDIPLPGNYPCLTMQLNITRYAAGALGRMVLVVREPSAGVEVHRNFLDTEMWEEVRAQAIHGALEALKIMEYLQDAGKGD